MATTPTAMSSSLKSLDLDYKKGGTLTATSCVDVSAKLRNIQSQIAILEDYTSSMRSSLRLQSQLNGAIYIATIIRDTSRAFLDLAGAFGESLGLKAVSETAEKFGTVLDNVQMAAEVMHGQNLGSAAAEIGYELGKKALLHNTPMTAAEKKQVEKTLDRRKDNVTSAAGMATVEGSAERQRAAVRAGVNTGIDTITEIMDLAADGATQAAKDRIKTLTGALNVLKAASNYGLDLSAAQDSYFAERYALEDQIASLEARYKSSLARLSRQLREALALMKACEGPDLTLR